MKRRFQFLKPFLGVGDNQEKRIMMSPSMKNKPSHFWWLESHIRTKRSSWLQSTLNGIHSLPY
ncbi:hypothetical protein Lal_00047971 [Lupinus albus]|nr:hypothetical protein Lal_00047971 [Lupinus albus]